MGPHKLQRLLLTSVCAAALLCAEGARAMHSRTSSTEAVVGEDDLHRAPPTSNVGVDERMMCEVGHDGTQVFYDMAPEVLSPAAQMFWGMNKELPALETDALVSGDLAMLQKRSFPALKRITLPGSGDLLFEMMEGVGPTGFKVNPQEAPTPANLVPFILPLSSAFPMVWEMLTAFGYADRTWVEITDHDLQHNGAAVDAFMQAAPSFKNLNLSLESLSDAQGLMQNLTVMPLDLRSLRVRTSWFDGNAPWLRGLTFLELRAPYAEMPVEWRLPESELGNLKDLIVSHARQLQTPLTLAFFLQSFMNSPQLERYSWEADGARCPIPGLGNLMPEILELRQQMNACTESPERRALTETIHEKMTALRDILSACFSPDNFRALLHRGLSPEGRTAVEEMQAGRLETLEKLAPEDYGILGRDVLPATIQQIILPENEHDVIRALEGLDELSFRRMTAEGMQLLPILVPHTANTPYYRRHLPRMVVPVSRLQYMQDPARRLAAPTISRESLSSPRAQGIFDQRHKLPFIKMDSSLPVEDLLRLQHVHFPQLGFVRLQDDPAAVAALLQPEGLKPGGFIKPHEGKAKGLVFWVPIRAALPNLAAMASRVDTGRFYVLVEEEAHIPLLAELPVRAQAGEPEMPPIPLKLKLATGPQMRVAWEILRTRPFNILSFVFEGDYFDANVAFVRGLQKLQAVVAKKGDHPVELIASQEELPNLHMLRVGYVPKDREVVFLPALRFFLETLLKAPNVTEDHFGPVGSNREVALLALNEVLDDLSEAREALRDLAKALESLGEGSDAPLEERQSLERQHGEAQDRLQRIRESLGDYLEVARNAGSIDEFIQRVDQLKGEASDTDDEEEELMPMDEDLPSTRHEKHQTRLQEFLREKEDLEGSALVGKLPADQEFIRDQWRSWAHKQIGNEHKMRWYAEQKFKSEESAEERAPLVRWRDAYIHAERKVVEEGLFRSPEAVRWILEQQGHLMTEEGRDFQTAMREAEAAYALSHLGGADYIGRIAEIYTQLTSEPVDMSGLSAEEIAETARQTWLEASRVYRAEQAHIAAEAQRVAEHAVREAGIQGRVDEEFRNFLTARASDLEGMDAAERTALEQNVRAQLREPAERWFANQEELRRLREEQEKELARQQAEVKRLREEKAREIFWVLWPAQRGEYGINVAPDAPDPQLADWQIEARTGVWDIAQVMALEAIPDAQMAGMETDDERAVM